MNIATERDLVEVRTKKAYSSPQVEKLGDLVDVTHGGGTTVWDEWSTSWLGGCTGCACGS